MQDVRRHRQHLIRVRIMGHGLGLGLGSGSGSGVGLGSGSGSGSGLGTGSGLGLGSSGSGLGTGTCSSLLPATPGDAAAVGSCLAALAPLADFACSLASRLGLGLGVRG